MDKKENNMKHDCEKQCKHKDVVYCEKCKKVYCKDCDMEWGEDSQFYYTPSISPEPSISQNPYWIPTAWYPTIYE